MRAQKPITLWILMVLFFTPPILAGIFYQFRDTISLKTKQAGRFIIPVIPLSSASSFLYDSNGTLLSPDEYKNRWLLVTIYKKDCKNKCENQLKTMESLHKSLGKDYDSLAIASLELNSLLSTLNSQNVPFAKEYTTLLIDPNQQLMMYYDAPAPWKGILADIKHLLKFFHEH